MKLELKLALGSFVDFAFGTVLKGKESQVYQEYFPMVAPAMHEHALKPLRPYGILASNLQGLVAEQGALTYVSSVTNFQKFYQDPRFVQAKPLRDQAMLFLEDGNLFTSIDIQLSLNSETEYALIVSETNPLPTPALLELALAESSPNKSYMGKSLFLQPWNETAEQLMLQPAEQTLVFRIQFFPEA